MEAEMRESSESKKGKRKSEKTKELSAAEKFNNFKKQRIENKGEGDIVDDLFKDFIAKKMKEIDAERNQEDSSGKHGKHEGAKSVKNFNKILDKELKHINVPSESIQIKSEKQTSEHKGRQELSVVPKTNSENLDIFKKEDPVVEGPSLPPLNKQNTTESEESAPVKSDSKKTAPGFRNFGIKLSLTSTELIKSGDIHKKGKRLEEGEVLTSENSDDSGSSSDDEEEGDLGEVSGTGSVSDSDKDGKEKSKKKKKKKKLKHKKKKKHKEKGKDEEKGKDVLVVKEEKGNSKRKVSITPRSKSRSKSPKKRRSRSRSKERRRRSTSKSKSKSRRSRSRSRSPVRSGSKYRRSRSRSRHRRSRSGSRSKRRRSRSGSRSRRKRSRSRDKRRRSPSPDRFWRSKYGNFDAYEYMKKEKDRDRRRGRSKSRTPDREKDRFIAKEKQRMEDLRLKIDKAKLREIAIKNAVEMAKTGVGPTVDVTFKAGGKSVEELTDFCKRISSKDFKKHTEGDSSSDEETTQRPASDDESFIHHPFKVKEAAIVMDIKNAKQLPTVTPAERLAQAGQLRLQFPVSSGSQHRQKEWVPVEKTEPMKLGVSPLPPPGPTSVPASAIPSAVPDPQVPVAPQDKVFEETPLEPVDISSIISERLSAVRKLAEDPHDIAAQAVLNQAAKKAGQWANSRMLPGQFIGSTGANILSQEELIGPDKKRQAWLKKMSRKQRLRKRNFKQKFSTVVVKKILLRSLNIARKDVFTNAAPVKSGIGMFLLQKMGWKQGEGLGKNKEGKVEPLLLDVKVDRKGLVTQGEGKKGGGGTSAPKAPVIKDLSGKHPVSALVELCNKRKWGPPQFEIIHESGPDHKKNFLFKVKVNGTEYQPSIASNNKKLAKAQSATVCLQELGLVPRTGPI